MTATQRTPRPQPDVDLTRHDGAAGPRSSDAERPLGEVVSQLGHDVSELVHAQLELAKVELRDQAKSLGRAGAMGGAATAVALAALVLFGMAVAWVIAEAWPAWSGFLIVAVVYAAVAGALAMTARRRLDEATDGPTETKHTLQEDARWLRQHKS